MLTSSGYNCDVCGTYILGLSKKDLVYPVKIKGIDKMVDCCQECIEIIKNSDGDWGKLPAGRLRTVFEENQEKMKEKK